MAWVSLAKPVAPIHQARKQSSDVSFTNHVGHNHKVDVLVPFGLVEQVVLTGMVSLGLETCSNSLTYLHVR